MALNFDVNVTGQQQVAALEKEVGVLRQKLHTLAAEFDILSAASDKSQKSASAMSISFSKLAVDSDKAVNAFGKIAAEIFETSEATLRFAKNSGEAAIALKGMAKEIMAAESVTKKLNSEFAKTATLEGELIALENAGYVAMKRNNLALAEKVKLRERELGLRAAEKVSSAAKEARDTSLLGLATSDLSKKKAELLALSDAHYVKTLAESKAIGESIRNRKTELGLIDSTNKGLDGLTNAKKNLYAATRGLAGATGNLWMTYSQVLPLMSAFVAAASAIKIFKTGTEFEFLNTFSSSLSEGAISVEKLNKELLNMKGVGQTPIELAKGMLELQKAGVPAGEAVKELSTVSKYAAVAQIELGASTEQLVTITKAFEKTSKGANGGMLTIADTADIVAFAAQKSTSSFSDMQIAFRYMTATASTSSFTIQEVAAALMVMANNGLKGSMGATSLRTAIERLKNPTEKASEMFKKLGGNFSSIYADGKFKGIQEIGSELERIKNTVSAGDWSEFSNAMFGFRGAQVNAIVTGMADLNKNIEKVSESVGFVNKVFNDLSKTTKMQMIELAASFERAFIKAFEGEKATEVIKELNDIVSGDGFANSLEHVATGAYGLSKGFAAIASAFLSLPTWVAEAGIVGAFLFGIHGKLILAGLIAAAAAVEKISDNIAKANASYAADVKTGGKTFADLKKETSELTTLIESDQARLSGIAGKSDSYLKAGIEAGIAQRQKKLAYLNEQIKNIEISKKSNTLTNEFDSSNQANISSIREFYAMERKEEQARNKEFENGKKALITKDLLSTEDGENKKQQAIEASHQKLMSMADASSTYLENSENQTLATKLQKLDLAYAAQEAFNKKNAKSEEERSTFSELFYEEYLSKRAGLFKKEYDENEKKNEKIRQGNEQLDEYIENSGNNAYARSVARIEKEKAAAEKVGLDKNKIEAKYWIDKAELERHYLETVKDVYRDLDAEADKAGRGNKSPLQSFYDAVDRDLESKIASYKDKLKPEDFARASAEAEELARWLKTSSSEVAKLSQDPLKGFIAGLRDAQREALTLGQIGYEMAKEFRSGFIEEFSAAFTDEGRLSDEISTISEKIKDMQYESLKGGQEQLDYLQKEYQSSLAGAMKGNEAAFQQYMSNLDSYLSKAKEEMDPAAYEQEYARVMGDLNKLNEEYADQTESIWDRLGDAWGSLTDRMVDKFADMVAQMAAQEMFDAVFGSVGKKSSTGSSAGSTATNTAVSTGVSEAIDWIFSGWADGGYMSANPRGGVINKGSGLEDDVFLGFTDGGATANYGMGGEFIVNKKATQKFRPALEIMNSEYYAGGGIVGNSVGLGGLVHGLIGAFSDTTSTATASANDTVSALSGFADSLGAVKQGALEASLATSDLSETSHSFASQAVDSVASIVGAVAKSGITGLASSISPLLGLAVSAALKSDVVSGYFSELFSPVVSSFKDTFGIIDAQVNVSAANLEGVFGNIDEAFSSTISDVSNSYSGVFGSYGATLSGFSSAIDSFSTTSSALQSAAQNAFGEISFGAEMTQESAADLSNAAASINQASSAMAVAAAAAAGAHEATIAAMEASGRGNAGGMLGDPDIDSSDRLDNTTPGGLMGNGGTSTEGASTEGTDTTGQGNGTTDPGGMVGLSLKKVLVGLTDIIEPVISLTEAVSDLSDGGPLPVIVSDGGPLPTPRESLVPDPYKSSSTNEDILSALEDSIAIVRFDGISEHLKDVTELNDKYSDLSKELVDLGASEDDLSIVRQANQIELNELIKEESERLEEEAKRIKEEIDSITEASRYMFEVEGLSEFKKQVYDTNKSYDDQVDQLKELEAAEEDITVVEAGRLKTIQDLYGELVDQWKSIVKDSEYIVYTSAFSDFKKGLYSTHMAYEDIFNQLRELEAPDSYSDTVDQARWIEINRKKAEEAQNAADEMLSDAEDMLRKAFEAERDSVTARYEIILEGLNGELKIAGESVSKLESVVSSLDSAIDALKDNEIFQEVNFRGAQADLRRRYLENDLSEGLQKTLEEAVQFNTNYYGSSFEYELDLKKSVKYTEHLKDVANLQLSAAETNVVRLEDLIKATEDGRDTELAALDAQLNALLGISESVMSLADAIANYEAAKVISGGTGGGIVSGGGSGSIADKTVFNTSDYIQAKATDLVASGYASTITEAAQLFLDALAKDGSTVEQHYNTFGEREGLYSGSSVYNTVDPVTYNSSGYNSADYIQAKAVSLFEAGWASSIEGAKTVFLDAIEKEGISVQQHHDLFATQEGVYRFASGGSFEVQGPSGSDNLYVPNVRLTAGEVVNVTNGDTMSALREEIVSLRQVLSSVVRNTADTAKQLSRWDGDGMPDVRTV